MSQEFFISIENLKDSFGDLQFNVNFVLTIIIGCLAFVVAASGWALWILSKNWAEKAANSKIQSIKEDILQELENRFIVTTVNVPDSGSVGFTFKSFKNEHPKIFLRSHDEKIYKAEVNGEFIYITNSNAKEKLENGYSTGKVDVLVMNAMRIDINETNEVKRILKKKP